MAASKLAERLAKRQGVSIYKGDRAEPEQGNASPPKTHREKLDQGWKRVATVLPPIEHQAFKIAALKTDREMGDIVRDLIAEWVKTQM